MVLPRPTASATRRRGWSWVVASRKGSRWKGRSSASISCPTVRSVLETGTGVRRMMLSRTRRVSIPLGEVSSRKLVPLGSSGSMRSISEKKDARRSRISSSRPIHRTTARAPMACRSTSVTCHVWSRTITREPAAIMSSSSMLVAGSTVADPLQRLLVGCESTLIAPRRAAGSPPQEGVAWVSARAAPRQHSNLEITGSGPNDARCRLKMKLDSMVATKAPARQIPHRTGVSHRMRAPAARSARYRIRIAQPGLRTGSAASVPLCRRWRARGLRRFIDILRVPGVRGPVHMASTPTGGLGGWCFSEGFGLAGFGRIT